MDFLEFKKYPPDVRAKLIQEMSDEEKAEVLSSQAQRWLDENRTTLTTEQIAIVEEVISSITPERFSPKRTAARIESDRDLRARVTMMLTRDQLRNAFTPHWDGACQLPKRGPT